MTDSILWLVLLLAVVNAVLLVVVLARSGVGAHGSAGAVSAELRAARAEAGEAACASREELARGLRGGNETLAQQLGGMAEVQRAQLDGVAKRLGELTASNQKGLDGVRATLDARLIELQAGNEKKLEQMRLTVDEKLQSTLEKRLGESFKLVSDQLESVQKGLGEMQSLATGVGDLKRVLTNVKARGTWAEVQLGALLEEILTPAQFERNVHVEPGSREMVEYAVKLPGPKDDPGSLRLAAHRLQVPAGGLRPRPGRGRRGRRGGVAAGHRALARAVRTEAQSIHDKYVKPPHTTDFAIMFLATEGLYAEVVRQPALVEDLQQRSRVVVAGPTTLAALSAACAWGSRPWRSSSRPSRSGGCSAPSSTSSASSARCSARSSGSSIRPRTIDETGVRTRAMERKLRQVEDSPGSRPSSCWGSRPTRSRPARTGERHRDGRGGGGPRHARPRSGRGGRGHG